MADCELIRSVLPDVAHRPALLRVPIEDSFSQLLLVWILTSGGGDPRSQSFRSVFCSRCICGLRTNRCVAWGGHEFFKLLLVIWPVRVVIVPEEIELGVVGLYLHDHLFEVLAVFRDIGGGLVDDSLDLGRRDDDSCLLSHLSYILSSLNYERGFGVLGFWGFDEDDVEDRNRHGKDSLL